MNPTQMAKETMKAIRGLVSRMQKPLIERLQVLESSAPKIRELTQAERAEIVASMSPMLLARHDQWALEFERSATELMLNAISNIPDPQDGEDGLGFDDMNLEHDGERKFTFVWEREGKERRKEFTLPVVIDRGVFKEGQTYQTGDGVTWAGSYWIAQAQTVEKPGTADWRLAVKKGRDGKNV